MSSSHDMASTHCDSRCHALAADLLPGDLSAHPYLGLGHVQRRENHRGVFARAAWCGSDSARGETIEQRFHQQFAGAAGLLDETPRCAQDRCELLLLLISRRIPATVARHVDAFVA